MMFRLLGPALAALLGACASPPSGPPPSTPACAAAANTPSADPRLRLAVEEARRQHQAFGAQTIERDGGMYRMGQHEAAWSRPPGGSDPAWQRVATFWSAVPVADAPGVVTSAGRVAIPPAWLADPAFASGTGELAARESLLRAAMMDTPWSAAFISHLMKVAGFSPAEFAFSDAHADYVQAAFDATAAEAAGRPASHAFRACDTASTRARAGDLLCATRAGTAHITGFAALSAALAARSPGEGFPMHCDLVVHADPAGGKAVEVIGGNVLNSVTLSRMTVDARGVLDDAYRAGLGGGGPHLSRRPWVVLLQARR